MKKTLLATLIVSMLVVSVMAAAQKVSLAPYVDDETGSGFVVVNNSANADGNVLEITVSLKDGVPGREYGVWLLVNSVWYPTAVIPFGNTIANKQGNANFHVNTALVPLTTGDNVIRVELWNLASPWIMYYTTDYFTITQ